MSLMSLSSVQKALQGSLLQGDVEFDFISIDSRTIAPGEVFVALKGINHNSHHYLQQAIDNGAVGAIVSEDVAFDLPLLKVRDTTEALGQLAALRREQCNVPVFAITGSCGKTTCKNLLMSILSVDKVVLATKGTLNNHFGLPLTLLKLTPEHQAVVVELGANHLGEIAYLTQIAKPDVAMITNAAAVHLEGFGSVKSVAQGKGEIFQGLTSNGVGVINADDHFFTYWKTLLQYKRVISFSTKGARADVMASNIQLDEIGCASFDLQVKGHKIAISLHLIGEHQVTNAVAVAACAVALDIDLSKIKIGLEQTAAESKRLNLYEGYQGATIIDDSYNANPLAFHAAINILSRNDGEKVLVLGAMAELGDGHEQYHRDIGLKAKQAGISKLFAYGADGQFAVDGFGSGAEFFVDKKDLIAELQSLLHNDMVVLVKGSRSMRMEEVVVALSVESKEIV